MARHGDGERPWWLRLDGSLPFLERRFRARWPDWDELTREEQVQRHLARQRYLRRDWLARHAVLTVTIISAILVATLVNLVSVLGDDEVHAAERVYGVAVTVMVLVAAWYWLRELRRARRGE